MNREVHVRFWESPEVKVLRATRQSATPIGAASMEELASIPDASEVNRRPASGCRSYRSSAFVTWRQVLPYKLPCRGRPVRVGPTAVS